MGPKDVFSSVNSVLSGYTDGYELVEGSHPDAIERFVLLSVGGSPRLLLPTARTLQKKSIRAFLGDRYISKLISLFVHCAKVMGGPFTRYSAEYSLVSRVQNTSPIRVLISGILGRNDFQIALRFSFGRPNGKSVAMAISDEGEVLCYVKIGSEAMTSDLVAHESTILEKYENSNLPIIFPRCLYSGTWKEEYNVLVTEPLQLVPLPRDAGLAHKTAGVLATSGMTEHSVLKDSAYWQNLVERVSARSEKRTNSTDPILAAVNEIERVWGDRDFTFGLSHGDWTRSNIGMLDGHIAGLDWERCVCLAPSGIDVVHFAMSEETSRTFSRALDIERLLSKSSRYLETAQLSTSNVKPLIMLAFLEMVIRFRSAESAGINSIDSKFGVALRSALEKWAV